MQISACYIVKNEEQVLARSLESLKNAVDEIVIVDTGSTDKTLEIAEQYTAQIYSFDWQSDFSAARNFALEKVRGDWVIFLDADDYFAYPDQVRAGIEQYAADQPSRDAAEVKMLQLDSQGKVFMTGYQMKILRRDRNLRYEGRIHEMLRHKGTELSLGYADECLTVYHTGYAADRIENKLHRNLQSLLQDIKEHGKSPAHDYYLADCYFGLHDFQRALQYATEALLGDLFVLGGRGKIYHIIIESMRQLCLPLEDMLGVAEAASRELPELPEFPAEQGMILCGLGHWPQAIQAFEKALSLYGRHQEIREDSYFSEAIAERIRERLQRLYTIVEQNGAKALRITACYIVKNEARNLARSMISLQGQVDEILVVDTGSADATQKIAESYGARVYRFAWVDDFAQARNYALKQAQGEWIVFLDADEYFSEATRGNLRAVLETEQEAELLLIHMRNIDSDTKQYLMDFYAPRIFRRAKGRRYEGRIHEELRQDGQLVEPMKRIEPQRLELIHTGYSVRLSKQKAVRNLSLLQQELKTAVHPERLYMYLAETYDGLEQAEQAMLYAQKDIDTGRKTVTYASRSYRILLRLLAARPLEYRRRRMTAERAIKEFPSLPDFHAEYAECLADELELDKAVEEAGQALQSAQGYDDVEPSNLTPELQKALAHRAKVWQLALNNAAALKISACLIMCNEEKELPVWLENMQKFADECIVIDTGSTDDSVQLAEQAGCRVYQEEWQQDFSAARNTALSYALGRWVTMLDADERFAEPEKVRLYLAMLELTHPDTEAVLLPIIHLDADDGNREIKRAAYTRLLKSGKGLYYEGRVHERLGKKTGELKLYEEDHRLVIYHTGYSTKRMQQKLLRNLELLQQEISEKGERSGHARYLADCYYGLGQYGLAERYALSALAESAKSRGAQSDLYRLVLYCKKEGRASQTEQQEFAKHAIERFPELPDFYGWLGMILAEHRDNKEHTAEIQQLLEKSINLYEHPRDQHGEATQFADFADAVYAELACCYAEENEIEKAELAVQRALQLNSHNEKALDLFCVFRKGESVQDLSRALQNVCGETEAELIYLTRFAESYGWLELLAELQQELERRFAYVLSQNVLLDCLQKGHAGDFAELAAQIAKEIQGLPVLLLSLEKEMGMAAQKLYKICIELLPEAMRLTWCAYIGEIKAENTAIKEGSALFFSAFMHYADDEQLERFLQLTAEGSSPIELCKSGTALMRVRRWQAALLAFAGVPADAQEADAEFWCRVGICFYELRQSATARECLKKALSLDGNCGEARAFMKWNEEETSC